MARFYLPDRQGTVVGAVNISGTPVATVTYEAFGRTLSGTPIDRYGYTGREFDATLGLYHYRDRAYDPAVGRFLQEDPIDFRAGDPNLYRYVGNSPTNATDPSGRYLVTSKDSAQGYVDYLKKEGFNPSTVQLSDGRVGVVVDRNEVGTVKDKLTSKYPNDPGAETLGKALDSGGGSNNFEGKADGSLAPTTVTNHDRSSLIRWQYDDRASYQPAQPDKMDRWQTVAAVPGVEAIAKSVPPQASNLFAGWADKLTFGGTDYLRATFGFNDVVDHDSTSYKIGSAIGTVHGIALAVVNPCGAGLAGAAVRVWNGAGAIDAGIQAGRDISEGKYLSAGLNFLSAVGHLGAAGRTCFAAGTPLMLPDGTAKLIEQFLPGDGILTRPEDQPDALPQAGRVAEIYIRTAPILRLRVRGVSIETTEEHPFWVKGRGWQPAGMIVEGDELLGADGRSHRVEESADTGQVTTVYNLQVADHHTYFVGCDEWGFSIWAHNACVSRIHDDPGLVRHAQAAGRTHQASIDRLTAQLGNGNFNPGIGTRGVFGNVLEARARDGARVYFRQLPNGDAEILAKSSKANQDAVISTLQRLYGG